MKFTNFTKSQKSVKPSKQQVVKGKDEKAVIVPKLQKHDVLFDLDHLEKLLNGNDFYKAVPNYINKFFFRYGTDIFYDNGKTFELLTKQDAKSLIPKNFKKSMTFEKNGKQISKDIQLSDYFDNDLFLKTNQSELTIDYKQDYKYVKTEYVRGFEVQYNYLNMKKDLPRNYEKELIMTDEIKTGVNLFFNHIKEVLCSGIEEEYSVVKKFFASSCVGHKVKICLVIQTLSEQAGKGTVLNAINDLLGNRMYKTANPEEVVLYTKNFEGCSLLNFDEVPLNGNFKNYQDCVKSLITEPTFSCRAMRQQPYQQKNTFNIVMTSNNNCVLLTQSNNVRYYTPTCSNKYAGNKHKEYFDKLYKYLDKEEVKIGIFKEFIRIYEEEVKPENWIGNNVGTTQAGQEKIIEALPRVVKFVKNEYLLQGEGINATVQEFTNRLHTEYKDNSTATTIGHYLGQLNVQIKKVDSKAFKGRKYIITFEDLKQAFINKKWINDTELEDLEMIEAEMKGEIKKPKSELDDDDDDDNNEKLQTENIELKKQIEELKKQIELLKKQEVPEIKQQEAEEEPKRKVLTFDELHEKVKKQAIQQPDYIEDKDDGYESEDLKAVFTKCTKILKNEPNKKTKSKK